MAAATTKELQLSEYLEMGAQITKETLLKLHQKSRLSTDYKISEQHTAQIIQILGGIKAVLEVCLASDESKLNNTNKFGMLHQIITGSNKIVNSDMNKEDCAQFEYTFDESYTFLHSLLGQTIAQKIRKIVEHKIVIALLIITAVLALILRFVFGPSHSVILVYNIAVSSIFIPWLLSQHTLFNKKAFKLCLKTFDYWIKIGYGIMLVICEFFYIHKRGNRSTLGIIIDCFGIVGTVLAISFVSSVDAFVMGKKKKFKVILCGLFALYCTWLAIDYQFFALDETEGTHIISLISLLSSSTKIMSIFFWKHTINTFRREERAVSLTITPTIKWIDSTNSERKSENQSIELSEEKAEIEMKTLSTDYQISEQDTTQIIQILGGINAVLEVCLASDKSQLTETNKLGMLHQIITGSNKIVNSDMNKEDCAQFEYTFDESNTFLHSLLGQSNAQKIRKFIEHKIVIAVLIIAYVINFTLANVFGHSHLVWLLSAIAVYSILGLPWLISKHTLFNKKAFKLCLKTFDYWIKIVYGILWVICAFFYNYTSDNRSTLGIIRYCLTIVGMVLMISLISSFDAFVMGKKKKVILCGILALYFTFLAIKFQFFALDETDYKIEIESNKGTHIISLISLMSSSARILSIFFWKQTINTFRRGERAVSLTITPTIKWIDSNQKKTSPTNSGRKSENQSIEFELSEEKAEIEMKTVKTVAHRKRSDGDVSSDCDLSLSESISSNDSSRTEDKIEKEKVDNINIEINDSSFHQMKYD